MSEIILTDAEIKSLEEAKALSGTLYSLLSDGECSGCSISSGHGELCDYVYNKIYDVLKTIEGRQMAVTAAARDKEEE